MTLVMTGLVWVQLVRDLCSWCGLRQVSRRTFVRALQEKGSVMLVPGGQAELVHTWRIKCKKEYVIYGRHKGQQPALFVPCQFPITQPWCHVPHVLITWSLDTHTIRRRLASLCPANFHRLAVVSHATVDHVQGTL